MVQCFYQHHDELIEWLGKIGYIYNDFGGSNPRDKKIHRSDCPMIHAGRGDIANVRKIVSRNLNELVKWVTEHRGEGGRGYTLCVPCVKSGRLPKHAGEEDTAWSRLAEEQFLVGYSEADSVYDRV